MSEYFSRYGNDSAFVTLLQHAQKKLTPFNGLPRSVVRLLHPNKSTVIATGYY